jgi:hypothetical protein
MSILKGNKKPSDKNISRKGVDLIPKDVAKNYNKNLINSGSNFVNDSSSYQNNYK